MTSGKSMIKRPRREARPRNKISGKATPAQPIITVPDLSDILARGNPELFGAIIGSYLQHVHAGLREPHNPEIRVIIAKDTGLGGYLVESGLSSGFLGQSVIVLQTGPMPIAASSILVRSMRCDFAVMITCDSSDYLQTTLRLLDHTGAELRNGSRKYVLATGAEILAGRTKLQIPARMKRVEAVHERYGEATKRQGDYINLKGLRVALDCAHGAAYKVAPEILWELGADLVPSLGPSLGCEPNGLNINETGFRKPALIMARAHQIRADVGIALNAAADHVVICASDRRSETRIVSGEHLLGVIAAWWVESGKLSPASIIPVTDDASPQLEKYLASADLKMKRVGPTHYEVGEYLQQHGGKLGGNVTGSIIFPDHALVGDGLLASLQVLAAMRAKDVTSYKLFAVDEKGNWL